MKAILNFFRSDAGVPLNPQTLSQIRRYKAGARSRIRLAGIDPHMRHTFGAIVQFAEHFKKEAIMSRGVFHEHATYVLGQPIAEPPDEKEIENVAKENEALREAAKAKGLKKLGKNQLKVARGNVRVVFSTENLLLNAYRQQCSGFPSFICVDYTHRLVLEKYNICVVGTVDPAQHFHFIAMAMTSYEDEDTHAHIFGLVKREVDSIVANRAMEKIRI